MKKFRDCLATDSSENGAIISAPKKIYNSGNNNRQGTIVKQIGDNLSKVIEATGDWSKWSFSVPLHQAPIPEDMHQRIFEKYALDSFPASITKDVAINCVQITREFEELQRASLEMEPRAFVTEALVKQVEMFRDYGSYHPFSDAIRAQIMGTTSTKRNELSQSCEIMKLADRDTPHMGLFFDVVLKQVSRLLGGLDSCTMYLLTASLNVPSSIVHRHELGFAIVPNEEPSHYPYGSHYAALVFSPQIIADETAKNHCTIL